MGLEYAGDKNTNGYTRFRFACPDPECQGKATFHAVWDTPPDIVPSGMPCPFEGDHEASWIVDSGPAFHMPGTTGGISNPHYSPGRAASEHRWMADQIGEAKRALNAEDQLEGKAASPYNKIVPNMDVLEKQGLVKKRDQTGTEQKERIIRERAKVVADDADEHITREIDKKHVGRRHDG